MSAKANVITGLATRQIYKLKSCRKILFNHKL